MNVIEDEAIDLARRRVAEESLCSMPTVEVAGRHASTDLDERSNIPEADVAVQVGIASCAPYSSVSDHVDPTSPLGPQNRNQSAKRPIAGRTSHRPPDPHAIGEHHESALHP